MPGTPAGVSACPRHPCFRAIASRPKHPGAATGAEIGCRNGPITDQVYLKIPEVMKSVRFWQTQKCSNIDMGSKELSTTLWSFGATQNMRKNDNPSGVCHEPGRVWITMGPHPGQETEFQATYQALAKPTSRSAKMCLVRCSLVAGTCWDGGPDRIVGRADSEHCWMSVESGDGIEVPSFGNLVLQVFFWNHWSIAELAKPRFLVFPWTLLGFVPQNWRSALTIPKESKIRAQWFQSKASMITIRFQLFQKQVTTSQESHFHFEQYDTGMAIQCISMW